MSFYRLNLVTLTFLSLSFGVALPASAQDRVEVDRTQITGNRELPKVLYIVPWKKPVSGDLSGKPLESVLDEALAPVDRDVFRRQVKFKEQTDTQKSAKEASVKSDAAPKKEK